jgi:CheY-like chemotaxis protein
MAEAAPDLLITDVLMPCMNGTDLAARAKADHGITRILFISGDIGNTPQQKFSGHDILAKPFTASALKDAAERALTERGAPI